MDERENILVTDAEDDVVVVDETIEAVSLPEVIEITEVADIPIAEVGVSSAFASIGPANDMSVHNNLDNRDAYDAHPISAITNLRQELNALNTRKTPQVLHSSEVGVASYYEWKSGAYDEYGYFVSIVPKTSNIMVCDGHDIFGVTVDRAGFIGNQNASIPRNNSYALVVTSGLVDVRCESDVAPGDCVTSNNIGYATKTSSGRGYRVIAVNDKQGVLYASIVLGVQACVTDEIGNDLNRLGEQIKTIEANTLAAVNTANSAFNKVSENANYFVSADKKAQDALDKAEQAIGVTNNIGNVLTNVNETATLAKTIAENAVTQATTLKDDAVKRANDAWAKADKVEKEAYSLCAKIDTYSVGEYSQAYGMTLDQAQSILEIGIIYAPTKHIDSETHKEQYAYGDGKVYEREFVPGYLYRWDYIVGGDIGVGWVTVGSSMSVYFTHKEPVANGSYQYWYADGDEIEDKNGSIGAYEPYALYKWEDDHWLAVATLKGNANNRAISMISQTANSVSAEVINARGDFASLDARITDEVSQVSMVATKLLDNGEINAAAIVASVNESESNVAIKANKIVLSGDTFFVDKDGNATTIDGSHITAGTVTANYIDSISGNIGGFKICEKSIYNEYDVSELAFANNGSISKLYMPSYNRINQTSSLWDYYLTDDNGNEINRDYVYVGTDGIGTYRINATNLGAITDASQTYMANGRFFSNKAEISGIITARSGYIGDKNNGFIIDSSAIRHGKGSYQDYIDGVYIGADGIGLGSGKFYVTSAGKMYAKDVDISGKVTATEGEFNGKVIANDGSFTNGVFDNCTINDTCIINGDLTARAIDIRYESTDGFMAIRTDRGRMFSSVEYDTPEPYKDDLCITGNTIEITSTNPSNGQITSGGSIYTYGTKFWLRADKGTGLLYGTWESDTAISTTSWSGAKHDIEPIDDRYSILFDNIEPVRFKYNNGQSDRYHTGFILEKLKMAMDTAEIDSSEFAAYCVNDKQTGEGGIRYEEIIALLVKEVQTLKGEIKEIKENG